MLQSVLILPVLILIGWCIWLRRTSWRYRWDRVLTLSIAFQFAGLLLCIPAAGPWLGPLLFKLTGIAHLRDFIGQLCFMSACGAAIYAVACRLVPDNQLRAVLRRIEIPSALAALVMLISMAHSRALSVMPPHHSFNDFLDTTHVPCLRVYWLTHMAICTYLLGYLVRLLLVLRKDPRSRASATLFILASAIGFIAIGAGVGRTIDPSLHIPALWSWVPLGTACGLAACASAWSWRGRIGAF